MILRDGLSVRPLVERLGRLAKGQFELCFKQKVDKESRGFLILDGAQKHTGRSTARTRRMAAGVEKSEREHRARKQARKQTLRKEAAEISHTHTHARTHTWTHTGERHNQNKGTQISTRPTPKERPTQRTKQTLSSERFNTRPAQTISPDTIPVCA